MENPYTVLGIPRNASLEQVKKAYFSLIREHPPEKDPQGFKRVRLAYDSLRDADKRSQTDLFLFNDPYGEFNLHKSEGRGAKSEERREDTGHKTQDTRQEKETSGLKSRVLSLGSSKPYTLGSKSSIDLRIVIYSLSDLSRTDFSDDFNDIGEGLDQGSVNRE